MCVCVICICIFLVDTVILIILIDHIYFVLTLLLCTALSSTVLLDKCLIIGVRLQTVLTVLFKFRFILWYNVLANEVMKTSKLLWNMDQHQKTSVVILFVFFRKRLLNSTKKGCRHSVLNWTKQGKNVQPTLIVCTVSPLTRCTKQTQKCT